MKQMNGWCSGRFLSIGVLVVWGALGAARVCGAPIRVLFLGHTGTHHNSDVLFPLLAERLGRDAIYFDYHHTVDSALGDAAYLNQFDAVLLYANHDTISEKAWSHLDAFIRAGGGFVPVHSASHCFRNEPDYFALVGAGFDSHRSAVFSPRTIRPQHPAIAGVGNFTAWDETYCHTHNSPADREVLQVRDVLPGDPIDQPEPWTWVRSHGKGRVWYTASGHDERVWKQTAFQDLIRQGILWSVGDARRAEWEAFVAARPPLQYEKRSHIANYEKRPEPLPYQLPLSPEASMQYTRAPVGFRWELFAAEPDIVNPIGLAWDERGRLWVAETVDYPNEVAPDRKGNDRIKILEDTDGDGRCDTVTVFAEGLNVPTSLTPVNGGVVVAQAPDFLFLKDTDGDGRADVRQVLNTGWGIRDTHAGPSHLRYGFDNRIWGSLGYSGYVDPQTGSRFGNGLFRMNRDGSRVEFMHQFNNNTWGLGFNESGEVFGSTANNNPSFFGGFPAVGYGAGTKGMSARMIADTPRFHPITPNVRQVDAFGAYTAGAGHTLATSDAFPPSWRNRAAFIGGPTGHLLGRFDLTPDGAGYRARNAFAVVASADEWFSPVAAEVGPDGHLWVADWYNFIIQHNPTPNPDRGGFAGENGKGNAHINPHRDRQHGRIYRLVWEGAPAPRIRSLADASPVRLIAALGDANLFWRLTAQRLLVEGEAKEAAPALRKAVTQKGTPAIHALWILQGWGELDEPTHTGALLSDDAALQRNAIRALPLTPAGAQSLFDTRVVTSPDASVRREAFSQLAQMPRESWVVEAAARLMQQPENASDPWLALALRAIAGDQAGAGSGKTTLGPNLLANGSFEEVEGDAPAGWIRKVYRDAGETRLEVVTDARARSGSKVIRIASPKGADASWTCKVAVKPGTRYRLSGWVKTEGVKGAMGGLFNEHTTQKRGATKGLQGTVAWTELAAEFDSGSLHTMEVNALFGGWGMSTGVVWYDDVQLQEVIPVTGGGGQEVLAGDPKRGAVLFHTDQVASCIRCHRLGGKGGDVGPALDGIGARVDAAYLKESLIDPQAAIAKGYPAPVSPMPPYGVLLEPQAIADLVAYLESLKAEN